MNKLFNLILVIFFLFFFSCNNDDGNSASSRSVNDFVWKGLNSWYYWKPQVSDLQDNRFNSNRDYESFINGKTPENLFFSLLYNYPNDDQFSWIVDDVNALLERFSGIETTNGMDFYLFRHSGSNQALAGIVNYVVPGSSAALQGIKRGDVFFAVNGSPLNTNNYLQLYDHQVSITFANDAAMNSNELIFSGAYEKHLIAQQLEINPVHYATVFDGNQRRAGYLVYNGFKANYNDELNAVFGEFRNAGITDLILDLRYNRGGSLPSALALAQMITGRFTGSPFVRLDFNDSHNSLDKQFNFESQMTIYNFVNGQNVPAGTQSINSLNLNNVYILTTANTASASELIISGLDAYIDVVVIGSETRGKFVGSRTLVDHPASDFMDISQRSRLHNYAMQPIVFAYFNAQNEIFLSGIQADYNISFSQYVGTLGNFGDPNSDAALANALSVIGGFSSRTNLPVYEHIQQYVSTKELQEIGKELYLEPGS
ncbi:MAG: S41 family peptidase [Flavobacteriaceae bacterium]|nr:S41 family peptidase [Flavobacteriaceae bacterium]